MRRSDWVDRLLEAVDGAAARPFAWHSHDCCTFAAECIDAMCGTTYAEELRDHYSDEASATDYLISLGGLEASVSSWLGPTVPRAFCQRGDILQVQTEHGPGVGVNLGQHIAVPGDRGLRYYPITAAINGWRVL